MMNMFFPIEDYYMSYDSPYERRRNEQLRRRGEAEAALRHSAEIEYYQQMKHEERERRRQEVMRRRQKEEYIRWKQHEMQRRKEEELRIHEKRLRQQEAGEPQWEVVRGPDGRLYRVALDPRDFEAAEKDKPHSHRKQKQKKTKPVTKNLSSTEEPDDSVGASKMQKAMLTKQNSVKEIKPRRKRVTIIVEDASDSEMEDELTSSPWRKRSPSPGQWMEPVDFA
jgi:hypothetical protein